MNFKDLHEYDANMTYPACNEYLPSWHEALDGIEVERAAGICSGGEVSFFCVLPHVKKQLVLIDHSYSSLYYAFGKYHAIEQYSAKEVKELLCKANNFRGTYNNFGPYVPAKNPVKELFDKANEKLPTANKTKRSGWNSYGLVPIWNTIDPKEITNFKRNRSKVSFLHGDINDLVDLGPFDLVYLSNALDYTGRDNTHDFQIEKIVKPGGYVAYCWSGTPGAPRAFVQKIVNGWEPITRIKPDPDRPYGMGWVYEVRRTPKEVTDAPQVAPSS